jgi:hypothetical protein
MPYRVALCALTFLVATVAQGEIWPRRASAAAAGTDYTADARFIACWMFEAAGDLGNDDCTNTSDLTVSGDTTQSSTVPAGFSGSHKSASFDGTTDYLYIADGASGTFDVSQLTDFSGGCWVNGDTGDVGTLMVNDDNNYWRLQYQGRDASDTGRFYFNGAYHDDDMDSSAGAQWYYLSFGYNGSTTAIYRSFAWNKDTLTGLTAPTDSTENFQIGAQPPGNVYQMDGLITHCWVADAEISATEQAEIFLCGLEGDLDGATIDANYGLDSCTANNNPWDCCSGLDAGTCVGCGDIDTCC